jgi:hypothetical protein
MSIIHFELSLEELRGGASTLESKPELAAKALTWNSLPRERLMGFDWLTAGVISTGVPLLPVAPGFLVSMSGMGLVA